MQNAASPHAPRRFGSTAGVHACAVLAAVGALCAPGVAAARATEPNDLRLAIGTGVGLAPDFGLGASAGHALVALQGWYFFGAAWGVGLELSAGFADGTLPLRLRAGVRYHIEVPELPLTPYLLAQGSFGVLYDVQGRSPGAIGLRLGGGADMALTAAWGLGALLAVDASVALAPRPGLYATVEMLVYGTWTF